jgi:hypothetical protein
MAQMNYSNTEIVRFSVELCRPLSLSWIGILCANPGIAANGALKRPNATSGWSKLIEGPNKIAVD